MILKKLDLRVYLFHSTQSHYTSRRKFNSRWKNKYQFSNYIFANYLSTIPKNLFYSKGAKRNASNF